MNNCTDKFIPESSTFSTTQHIGLLKILDLCLHSFNFLFGFPTHFYVIWLIITGTGSGVASEFFILNISVCELASTLNIFLHVLDRWFSSIKTFKYFLFGLGITGLPLFQCLICVERYLAVVHPVTFLKFKPLRYRVICSTVVWMFTLGSCLCCLFTLVSCNFYIYVCCFSLQFLLFLCIQLFCLVAVLRALKQPGPGERGRKREENNHTKSRAFYLILITTVSMIIIYVPYTVTGFHSILTQGYFQEPFTVAFFCYILAGFVQPVLYLNRVGKLSSTNNLLKLSDPLINSSYTSLSLEVSGGSCLSDKLPMEQLDSR
ncbi:chemokine XC receptor 1-like [Cyprinus carpio]|uniref:Chemokine XC receptor 1-like n=1 Tax=Cyprinus carpio TaxID=7962 RepID=A0A9Q9VLV5_CYPCA|nr:chemokine XC receptor 1-like [Cyprinus carpio]